MFIYYFTHIGRSFGEVVEHLLDHPADWLPECLHRAYVQIDQAWGKTQAPLPHGLDEFVEIELGTQLMGDGYLVLPISMRPKKATFTFPRIEAELEVARVWPHQTQLTMRGTYHHPMREYGELVAGVQLTRIAEASLRAFTDQIASHLQEPTHLPHPQTATKAG